MPINKGLFSSERDDWETPAELFRELDKEFSFELDPCANDQNHKCARYFTKETDGLAQSWDGACVFVNPPYGRILSRWVKKGFEEAKHGATVVMLIPARTDTKWFHEYVLPYGEIRFLKNRLNFEINGVPIGRAPFLSMVVIFRPKRHETKATSTRLGRWVIDPGIGCKCSACGFDIGNDLDFMEYVSFCPSCGAQMEG